MIPTFLDLAEDRQAVRAYARSARELTMECATRDEFTAACSLSSTGEAVTDLALWQVAWLEELAAQLASRADPPRIVVVHDLSPQECSRFFTLAKVRADLAPVYRPYHRLEDFLGGGRAQRTPSATVEVLRRAGTPPASPVAEFVVATLVLAQRGCKLEQVVRALGFSRGTARNCLRVLGVEDFRRLANGFRMEHIALGGGRKRDAVASEVGFRDSKALRQFVRRSERGR